MGEIIWQKGDGAGGNVAWGSWQNAKAPRLRTSTSIFLCLQSRPILGRTLAKPGWGPGEFMDATLSIWRFPPESAKRQTSSTLPSSSLLKRCDRPLQLGW